MENIARFVILFRIIKTVNFLLDKRLRLMYTYHSLVKILTHTSPT